MGTTFSTQTLTVEGSQIPPLLKIAIASAGKNESVCRITYSGVEVALISAKWVPLIMRLTRGAFTGEELDELFEILVRIDKKFANKEDLRAWAENLSPQ